MADRESRLEEAGRLTQMLIHFAEEAKADFTRIAAGFDLPVHLARAVLALENPEPMRELAERLTCDRSYITNLADQLEERRLVSRVPGGDRRVKLLQLTRTGRSLRDRLSPPSPRRPWCCAGSPPPTGRRSRRCSRSCWRTTLARLG